jgi:hypothetical protein
MSQPGKKQQKDIDPEEDDNDGLASEKRWRKFAKDALQRKSWCTVATLLGFVVPVCIRSPNILTLPLALKAF